MDIAGLLSNCFSRGIEVSIQSEGSLLLKSKNLIPALWRDILKSKKQEIIRHLTQQKSLLDLQNHTDSVDILGVQRANNVDIVGANSQISNENEFAWTSNSETDAAPMGIELPHDWEEAYATLLKRRPIPKGITASKWEGIVERAYILFHEERAHLLDIINFGWGLIEVFGCHKSAPQQRFDGMGLLMVLTSQMRIAGVSEASIILQCKNGSIQTYRKEIAITCSVAERSTLMAIE